MTRACSPSAESHPSVRLSQGRRTSSFPAWPFPPWMAPVGCKPYSGESLPAPRTSHTASVVHLAIPVPLCLAHCLTGPAPAALVCSILRLGNQVNQHVALDHYCQARSLTPHARPSPAPPGVSGSSPPHSATSSIRPRGTRDFRWIELRQSLRSQSSRGGRGHHTPLRPPPARAGLLVSGFPPFDR